MKKILIVLLFLLGATSLFAQLLSKAHFNRTALDQTVTDRPWASGGIRSVHVANDLDGDGKLEIIATDYSNGGRVHVLEYVDNDVLEVVWSSPIVYETNPNSTPRWVQTGDLDGDGLQEIIFPLGPRYTGGVQVYEYQGSDNDFGTSTVIDFPADMFVVNGNGAFRMDRERGSVADFDGDGKSELILANQDNNIYILSINGNAPGFASWVIEGGDLVNNATSKVTGASQWLSLSADIDGDGVKEIVSNNWNYYGFSTIEVNGEDSYTFPSPNPDANAAGPSYIEFLKADAIDGVGYMGIAVADVDGDGKDEIAGVAYPVYDIALVSQAQGSNGTDTWDASDFSILKIPFDITATGDSAAQFWGCYAADLNGNGKDEILAGGFYKDDVVALEYNGSGDIHDGANYNVMHYYGGGKESEWEWETITISDSAGVIDTTYSTGAWGNPGVMKMSSGDILGNDGKPELVIGYQANVYDSMTVVTRTWDGTTWLETEGKIFNDHNIQIRVLQYDNGTGVIRDLNIVTPNDFVLAQNYPNPFNPTTNIRFSLPISKKLTITIYDMLGSEVKTLVNNEEFAKGSYEATWDGTNNFGSKVASGNYIATMKYGNFNQSIKMQLLK